MLLIENDTKRMFKSSKGVDGRKCSRPFNKSAMRGIGAKR
jgi:hypothetical protein